jgi:hypothetical protein
MRTKKEMVVPSRFSVGIWKKKLNRETPMSVKLMA